MTSEGRSSGRHFNDMCRPPCSPRPFLLAPPSRRWCLCQQLPVAAEATCDSCQLPQRQISVTPFLSRGSSIGSPGQRCSTQKGCGATRLSASLLPFPRILQPLHPSATLTLHYGTLTPRRRSNLLTGFNGNWFVARWRLAGLLQAASLIAAA